MILSSVSECPKEAENQMYFRKLRGSKGTEWMMRKEKEDRKGRNQARTAVNRTAKEATASDTQLNATEEVAAALVTVLLQSAVDGLVLPSAQVTEYTATGEEVVSTP
jgi:hypothetical protein